MSLLVVGLLALALAAGAALTAQSLRWAVSRYLRYNNDVAELDLASLFVYMPTRTLLAICTGFALIGTCGLRLAGVAWPFAGMLGLACLFLPRVIVGYLKKRRAGRIAMQLPDALSMWAGLLRTGQAQSQALVQVAEHQPAPMGDELRVLVRQCRVGVTIESAFDELRQRIEVPDLTMLATLLRAARELGGNLAESLQRLADVMRARIAMEARIRAMTAQGRLQGLIVGALPLLLLVVLTFMEPAAMNQLFTTPKGWVALLVIAVLETTGYFLIRRIVSIDV